MMQIQGIEGEAVNEPGDSQTWVSLEERSYRVDTNQSIVFGSSRFFEHLRMHLAFDRISPQVRLAVR